jgi:hypothetical protein
MPVEELTITGHGYLTSPLTENIRQMDDGSLVVEDCPIARSGFQTYQCRDLPQKAARNLGVDLSNPSASIDLYRPEEDVFNPEFIASLEGRPICDNHPPSWVTPFNFNQYAQGHIQNVRRGDEPLPSGDWPLLADLVISGEPLVGKVRDKQAREISLGYDYGVSRDGNKIIQCDMVANHLAVVPKGRAGDDVRIMDAAPGSVITVDTSATGGSVVTVTELPPARAAPPEPAAQLPPEPSAAGPAAPVINAPLTRNKEKPKVKNNIMHIFGLGLKAKAADAETSPEELAEMASDVGKIKDTDPDLFEETTERDRKARDRKAKDEPVIDPVDRDPEQANDRRKVMHDALDRLYDASGGRGVKDTDMEELKALLGQFIGEEATEPQHEEDADPAELEELLGAGEQPDAEDVEADPGEEVLPSGEESLVEDGTECAHCSTAHDLEACPQCGCTDKKAHAKDRARAADGVAAVLRMIRPAVARTNDSNVRRAYNTALGTLTRRSRATIASYGDFARGSRARGRDVGRDPNPGRRRAVDASQPTRDEKMQQYYDKARTAGGK